MFLCIGQSDFQMWQSSLTLFQHLSFPTVNLKIFFHPNLTLKSPSTVFMRYPQNTMNRHSSSSNSYTSHHHLVQELIQTSCHQCLHVKYDILYFTNSLSIAVSSLLFTKPPVPKLLSLFPFL